MVLARKKKAQSNLHEGVVAHVNNVTEETPVDVLDDRTGADFAGVGVLGFAHPFCSDLQLRFNRGTKCYTITLYLGLMKAS